MAISRLQACKDSSISIPELSNLLRVKTTTLNARLRRQHIAVQTVGRTNFVPGLLALQLAELHKHALIGWPTLQQASEISGVKAATIKARCEKGQLRSYRDLTKRLRVNPSELDGLQLRLRTPKPAPGEVQFKAPICPPFAQRRRDTTGAVHVDRGGTRKAPRSSAKRAIQDRGDRIERTPLAPSLLPVAPLEEPQIDQGVTPPCAAPVIPEIKIISRRDYGLPEVEDPSDLRVAQKEPAQKRVKTPEFLTYDPDRPFSIAACAVGKTVRYDGYDGTIVGIVEDPFSPKIKVRFEAHRHPLMREVLLIVGRRKVAE